MAHVVSFSSSLISRRGRGRVYLPALPEASIGDSGNVVPAIRDDTLANFQDWITGIQNSALAGANRSHVIFSCMDGATRDVLQYRMGLRVDTQRRRLQRETL